MNKDELLKVLYDKEKWNVYRKFKEIEDSTAESDELYKYFDVLRIMLEDDRSFIRVRAFRLICSLAKYDKNNKINNIIDLLLNELDDDKPTAVRQCLNAISNLILYKIELTDKIENKLDNIDYSKYKDSMSPLIKKDIEDLKSRL